MATCKLNEILVNEGIKQSRLADISGLSLGTINKAAKGKRQPSPTAKAQIVIALNKAIEELKGTKGAYTVSNIWPESINDVWSSLKAQYHEGLQDTELKQERIKAEQAIDLASKNYHQRYLKRHCNIKVLPGLMDAAKPLDTIYTAVKFLKGSDLKYFSLDNLEDLYRESGKRLLRVGNNERQDGLTAANNEQYLMVLGGPGVGKSTFLRKLGLEALENRLAHNLVPVFIELKSFKSEEMTLLEAIANELEVSGFPYAESLVESMLSDGKMLILLDGLDEVLPEQVDGVIEQIRNFCDQYQQNRFVASCRVAAYKGGFNRFTNVTIAEFDDDQIEQFIRDWFSSELDEASETAKQFWEMLQRPENASSNELAQTPLLLTFLCLVYDRSQSLPAVRSTLYGDALNIILKDWAAEKRIKQAPIYQGFHTDLEKELLSEIAYQSFKDNQLFFSEQEITEQIAEFLTNTLGAPQHLDGTAVLEAIEVQQGILVERATDAYSFSHLTLQEYLTASHIFSEWSIQELVSKHLIDKRWREVFLLVSGLAGKRSHELLLALEQQANTFVSSQKLQGLLQWATGLSEESLLSNRLLASRALLLESAINIDHAIASISNIAVASHIASASTIASAITRAVDRSGIIAKAVISVFGNNASENAIAIVRAIDIVSASASDTGIVSASASANALVRAIDSNSDIDYDVLSKKLQDLKQKIPSHKTTFTKWWDFTNQLIETFLTFFHLDKELITFTLEEAQALEKYLYATKLIIDCKNAAVRVSRKEWEAIESRLLTPPDNPTNPT